MGSRFNNLFELSINDFPLGIDDALELVGILNSDLSSIFLSLEFQFNVQKYDFRIDESLRLLFETSIRESLFKGNSIDQK